MKKKIDYGLKFYREVFKLDSLHFGYWDAPPEITLANLRVAQDKYIENLISLIPSSVKTILDVGCGTGPVAKKLEEKGYLVESVTPDESQGEVFRERNPDIELHLTRFEDYNTDKKYNLLLFAESFQYMNIDLVLGKSCMLLSDGGYLLISDYFRKSHAKYYKTCHVESDFLNMLKKYPLEILNVQDITEKVIPTLVLGSKVYNEYALPILEIISGYARSKFRIITRLLNFLFYFQLKKIDGYLYSRMQDKLNPEKFRKSVAYKVFLVKKI